MDTIELMDGEAKQLLEIDAGYEYDDDYTPTPMMFTLKRPIEGVPDGATPDPNGRNIIFQREKYQFLFHMPHEYKVGTPSTIGMVLELPLQVEVGDRVVLLEAWAYDEWANITFRAGHKDEAKDYWIPAEEMIPQASRWEGVVTDVGVEPIEHRYCDQECKECELLGAMWVQTVTLEVTRRE